MKKTIFVTGGTGFVGSHLIRLLLEKGHTDIRALRRSSSKMDLVKDFKNRVSWIEGDILNVPRLEEAMNGVAQVYHCAAMVSFQAQDVAQMMKVNVEGTANVVNVAMFCEVEKLIYVSSIAAIGRNANQPDISEANKWQRSPLNSNYAISKYQAEQEVWRASVEGLNVGIVNPSVVLGEGDWSDGSAALFRTVWDGLPYYSAGATGFVDVKDVVQFMTLLMDSDIVQERFILNGSNQTFQYFFQQVARQLQKKPPTIKITPLLGEIAWRFEWLKSLWTKKRSLITRETVRTSQHSFRYNSQKSENAFGFSYTPFEESVARTAAAFVSDQQHK